MTDQAEAATSISLAITGSGGAGVISAGNILLDAAAAAGWYGLSMRSSGPQIRGGEAAAMLRLARRPVEAPDDRFQILIALDWHNIERFAVELPLAAESLVLADPAQGEVPEVIAASGAEIVEAPLKELAKGVTKGRPNMIALGILTDLLHLETATVMEVVTKVIGKKGAEALRASEEALEAGRAWSAEQVTWQAPRSEPAPGEGRWLISGNQAAGLGALRGGVRFAAAYPITPATDLLEWLAPNLGKVGGLLVQAEDELASINMIIGASYGGTPSLTATSGPGLALMSESIGLAVASEVPITIVDVMRGGPSTGIPTKSEQSDLNIALFGLHGDAPHLVLAPHSVADCVFTTQWSVHLAEALQTPAIVLSDQLLGQTRAIIDRPADLAFVSKRVTDADAAGEYRRYVAAGGVSPMAVPGMAGGQYTAEGLEHDEKGRPSSQASDHERQLNKRRQKLEDYDYGSHWALLEGDGPLAVITWGSTTGAVREALGRLDPEGTRYRLVALRLLAPAQPARLSAALAGAERALVIEQSHSAQFAHYLRGYFDLPCPFTGYHRPGPLPLRPGELARTIDDWSTT